jgi:hypothetical protein
VFLANALPDASFPGSDTAAEGADIVRASLEHAPCLRGGSAGRQARNGGGDQDWHDDPTNHGFTPRCGALPDRAEGTDARYGAQSCQPRLRLNFAPASKRNEV